jgi:PAS domain S-box-containing protein
LFCVVPYIISGIYINRLITEKIKQNYIQNANDAMERAYLKIYEGLIQPSCEMASMIALDKTTVQLVNAIGNRIVSGKLNVNYNGFQYFDVFNKTHNNTPVMALGTEQGGYMLYPGLFTESNYDPRTRPWYQAALRNKGKPVISDPYIRIPENDLMIAIAQTVEAGDRTIGVIVFGSSADAIENAAMASNLGSSGYMMILNEHNKFIVSPKHKDWLAKTPDEINVPDLKILNTNDGGFYGVNIGGEQQYMSIRTFDKTGWKAAAIINAAELSQQVNQFLFPCLIVFSITFILIMMSILRIAAQILKPVNILTEAALTVAAGNLDVRARIQSDDEFGVLAQNFNEMVAKLKNNFGEIEEQNSELYLREREFKTLVDNAQDIILRLDIDLCYVYINPAIIFLTGKASKDFIGKELKEAGFPNEFTSAVATIQQSMARNETTKDRVVEFEYQIGNGDKVWLQAHIIPEFDPRKKVNTILSVVRNITEHKNMEKYIAHMDRLNTVGEMAAGIAHEVRNPMTTVRGFLQILGRKARYAQDEKYFVLMIEELDRANSIIKEFLSLAKNKSMNLEAQNINKIIQTILPLLKADAIISNSQINVELAAVPELDLDEKDIRQLLLNMVRNGIESMAPQGGVVTIRTYAAAGQTVLAVSDQGSGIDLEFMEKLGIPFATTKDYGTGLGLAVCYSIAARHKAKIDVKTSSKGTTFFIRFGNIN